MLRAPCCAEPSGSGSRRCLTKPSLHPLLYYKCWRRCETRLATGIVPPQVSRASLGALPTAGWAGREGGRRRLHVPGPLAVLLVSAVCPRFAMHHKELGGARSYTSEESDDKETIGEVRHWGVQRVWRCGQQAQRTLGSRRPSELSAYDESGAGCSGHDFLA